MSRSKLTRAISAVLIGAFAYPPVTGNIAIAQTQNTTSNYLYDALGHQTQITNPLGQVTNLSYDALNRIKQQVQPVPATGVARPTINFNYDGLDQPSSVIDPRNLTTSYTIDGQGKQTNLTSPDRGSMGRTFDGAGNLLTSTDARGKVTTYSYDVLNRLTSLTFSSGLPTTFEYDGGSSGAPNAIGRMTRMVDEAGQTSYSYDQMGRVISKTQSTVSAVGTVNRVVGYAYNSSGQLVSVTYPSGNRITYSYDTAGQVSNVTLNPSDGNGGTDVGTTVVLLDHIQYAPFGGVLSWTWGNSTESLPNAYARTYDLDGRVATYLLGNPGATTPGVVRTMTYDAASRVMAMTHSGSVNASLYDQNFTYDGLGRLTTFSDSSGSQTFAYDANGNRTQFKPGAGTYVNSISATSNRLNTTTGPYPAKSNQYDAAGNLTTDGTISYAYSDRGRMKSSTNAGVTTSYLYNGLGQRVSKTSSLVPTGGNEYVYDEGGHLLGEYDATGVVVQETVFLAGVPIAVLKQGAIGNPTLGDGTSVYYVYVDHISTPRLITDAGTGSVVWSWMSADPFGIAQPNENPSGTGTFGYNVRFPGQLFDRESNNYYNYYRDYDPQTGRYVESDPIGLGGGTNTYAYVSGNPILYVDSRGLQRGPALLGLGGYTLAGKPVAPSSSAENSGPKGLWSDFSNAPNVAPDLPGEFVGVNYPWSMPELVSVCVAGYYGSSLPWEKASAESGGLSCPVRKAQEPGPVASASGWQDPRGFTCTQWKVYPKK
jgi:RHS repeat-associated protein